MTTDRGNAFMPARNRLTRRRLLRVIGAHAAAIPAIASLDVARIFAADPSESLNRFPRMVHEFFVRQVRESASRHLQRIGDSRPSRMPKDTYGTFASGFANRSGINRTVRRWVRE